MNGAYKFEVQPDKGSALVLADGSSITIETAKFKEGWCRGWLSQYTLQAIVEVSSPGRNPVMVLATGGESPLTKNEYGVEYSISPNGELGNNDTPAATQLRQQYQQAVDQVEAQRKQIASQGLQAASFGGLGGALGGGKKKMKRESKSKRM